MFRSMEATYTEVTREVITLLYLHHDDDHKNDHYHEYISRITMMIILGIEMMITLVLTTRWPPPPCPTWKRWSRSLSNEPRIFVRNQPRPGDLLVIVTNRIVVLSVMAVMFKSFQKTLGSSQGNNPEQANSDFSWERIVMLLVMFALLVSFSSMPQIFEGNWTWPGERWSGLVGDLAVEAGDDFDLGDAVLIVFGGRTYFFGAGCQAIVVRGKTCSGCIRTWPQ